MNESLSSRLLITSQLFLFFSLLFTGRTGLGRSIREKGS